MIKKVLQTILATTFAFSLFSCTYRSCDEDCAIGHGKAMCAEHPETECNCFNKFKVDSTNNIYRDDQQQ